MRLPKYAIPVSIIGSVTGCAVLFKDYMSGGRYEGDERISGKTVIVTGANSGIGKETARDLARRGGRIIMACRDLEKCELARKEMYAETANRSIECRKLDLASFASIRAFVKLINSSERHVDILVNNAAVMMCPKKLTEDGLEMQMGVNHFGHFLLTYLLLDKLKASAPSRIINVSSLVHSKGKINFDDLNSAKNYDRSEVYNQSKLANALFSQELARRLQGTDVTVNSLHPGIVNTNLSRHMSATKSYFAKAFLFPVHFLFFKSPAVGAQTSVKLAVDPSLESVTGKYFSNCSEAELSEQAMDAEIAKRLWAISEAWTGCKES